MRQRRTNRGAALVIVAAFLGALFALTAVGIDVGRLAHTATEVQTVADAAARAGANALHRANGAAGEGIDGAHDLSILNVMNGEFAPDGDVLVDEGFWNPADGKFECCTSHTPCCNGETANYGDLCTGIGPNHDCDTRRAVLAAPRTTVSNLFAGIFDFLDQGRFRSTPAAGSPNKTTAVEKIAVGVVGGPGNGCQAPAGCDFNDWGCYCSKGALPCLPIGAPSCRFIDDELPDLVVSPSGNDTAAWTGYQSGHSTTSIRHFLDQPPSCPAPGNPDEIGNQGVSLDEIDVTNGENGSGNTSPFALMKCIWNNRLGCSMDADGNISGPSPSDGRVFMIPIFELASGCSENPNGMQEIVGFATVRVTNVIVEGSTKRINIETLANASDMGDTHTGECFGTSCGVALAR